VLVVCVLRAPVVLLEAHTHKCIKQGPMTSPCPDKSYPSHCRVLAGGQSPVEAYVGIKELYQGIFW
jgi:hypothetical protein